MGIINLLSENLINQIAAGEVVERPASVAKELIENSIDAGATEIIVDIEDGGKRLIRVADNGIGMSREDAALSLTRHATSKIRESEDLFNICTLGFRGEALPSIASVSRLTLSTVPDGEQYGTLIRVEGGKEIEARDFGGPTGTSVEVRDLFFNTPARLKFLKSTTTEFSHIAELIVRMALSNPEVRFILNHNGGSVYNLPASKAPLSRLCRVTAEDEKGFIPVSLSSTITVRGFISGPEINRPTQKGVYLFVNGRYVRDRIILHALMDGYENLMEKGRYPVASLFIDLPPSDVDVNVHPAKSEVRFRKSDEIHRAVYAAVSEALKNWSAVKSGMTAGTSISMPQSETSGAVTAGSYQNRVGEALGRYAGNLELGLTGAGMDRYPNFREGVTRTESGVKVTGKEPEMPVRKGPFSSLQVLGRTGGTYIVCTNGTDLFLIDQHAAHERVAFEALRKGMEGTEPASQRLLMPEMIDLPPAEGMLLEENLEMISRTGFAIERFSGQTFAIKAVPDLLKDRDVKGLIRDMVDEISHTERSRGIKEMIDSILSRLACHRAVEGGDRMDEMEISALFASLDSIDFSSNCPHGRPVFVVISKSDMEKMFGRK